MEAEISFNRLGVAVTGCAMSEDRVRQPAYEALCVCPEHRCLGRVYNFCFCGWHWTLSFVTAE